MPLSPFSAASAILVILAGMLALAVLAWDERRRWRKARQEVARAVLRARMEAHWARHGTESQSSTAP